VDFAGAEAPEAAGVPAAGASAAMEAAAKPKVNKAVVIRVADFFMRSPNVVWALRCEEYDGMRRFGPHEDHFTIGVWRNVWVLRTCQIR
jgi:hypothetical protein